MRTLGTCGISASATPKRVISTGAGSATRSASGTMTIAASMRAKNNAS